MERRRSTGENPPATANVSRVTIMGTETCTVVRAVVASPNDVLAERNAVNDVATELNRGIAAELGFRLDVVRWETDAFPSFHCPRSAGGHRPNFEELRLLHRHFWEAIWNTDGRRRFGNRA